MTKTKRSRRRSRFAYPAIVERVERARLANGRMVKDMLAATGMDGPSWYRKMAGERSSFTLDELGAIADALDAPPGWPFVEWDKEKA